MSSGEGIALAAPPEPSVPPQTLPPTTSALQTATQDVFSVLETAPPEGPVMSPEQPTVPQEPPTPPVHSAQDRTGHGTPSEKPTAQRHVPRRSRPSPPTYAVSCLCCPGRRGAFGPRTISRPCPRRRARALCGTAREPTPCRASQTTTSPRAQQPSRGPERSPGGTARRSRSGFPG